LTTDETLLQGLLGKLHAFDRSCNQGSLAIIPRDSERFFLLSNRSTLLELYDAVVSLRTNVLPNIFQSRLRGKPDQLRHRPLLRRHRRHHPQILTSFKVRRVGLAKNDPVDQQSGVARSHGVGHNLEDLDTLSVRPVVQDGAVVVEPSICGAGQSFRSPGDRVWITHPS
jgi:hypothetical protein